MNSVTAGEHFPATLAGKVNAGAMQIMEKVFGPGVRDVAFAGITWADIAVLISLLVILILAHGLTASFLRRKILRIKAESNPALWRFQIFTTCSKPLYLLIWIYGLYFAASLLLTSSSPGELNSPVKQLFDKVLNFGVFFVVCWLFFRLTRNLEARLLQWAAKSESKLDDILIPLLGKAARVLIPVVAVILMLPVIGLPPSYGGIISKGSSLMIIGVIAWILFQVVRASEQFVLGKYDVGVADNLQARKVHTQVKVISKTVYFIIGIFTLASALMMFDEVRRVGTSILASAGVLGLIVGFAAQKTIANLFAGFQLAMTQPIRLDDVVIVDSEWGRVEEMTLTYVIVHIWDDRRLVVPLSYFIDKPFQNWTRVSANLMGSVVVWVDYVLPVSQLRQSVQKIVECCQDWDGRFWNLQVTDASERAMQIRVLATAADSGKAWNLRCEIREKIIELIQNEHPLGLPRLRGDLMATGIRPELATTSPFQS